MTYLIITNVHTEITLNYGPVGSTPIFEYICFVPLSTDETHVPTYETFVKKPEDRNPRKQMEGVSTIYVV